MSGAMKQLLAVITPVRLLDPDAHPEHPIAPGGGGGDGEGEHPPSGAHPAHPIYYPDAHPEHPIAPGGEKPTHPIAPGGTFPAHPIVIPPTPEVEDKFDVQVGWTEENGWVVVLIPKGEHPVPSQGKRQR